MLKANLDIRETVKKAGVKLWQVADVLGCNPCALSVKLRRELEQDEKEQIFSIIEELKGA